MKMSKKLLIPAILIAGLMISTAYGAYLSYKAYVEIYGYKYPLGIIELDVGKIPDIEGLEAREDYLGVMRVWTYSNDAQLVVQLAQLSQIVTNFRSFTVKVCLPLDVVFVVDITGSMAPYMDAIKAEMKDLIWVLATMNKCPVQVAVVGFKDYPTDTIVNPSQLTMDYGEVEGFIDGLEAITGDDAPQSHYIGLLEAKRLFEEKDGSEYNDKIVVFITDAESGYDDAPEFSFAAQAARSLAEMGVKIHPVLCFFPDPGPNTTAEEQLNWYAAITNGNMVYAPWPACRFVPGVTSNPTWMVKLTPIMPFDSFRLKVRSSEPTQKEGFYTFHIWVDFFCKAVPWHEFFVTELMANLEKAEIPPLVPEPPTPQAPPPPIGVSLFADPIEQAIGETIDFTWDITSPPEVVPVNVMLTLIDPTAIEHDYDQGTTLSGTYTWTVIGPEGSWMATLTYTYEYLGTTYYAGAFASFTVTPP